MRNQREAYHFGRGLATVLGMSDITDASDFTQKHNSFHLHLTSVFENPNSNDYDLPSDMLKMS
jgi:hypothetical protein